MKKGLAILTFLLVTIFSSILAPVYAATEPIAYWKFDDGSGTTATDSSGNGINGTFTSTAPTWSTDVPSAITFDDPYSLDFTSNGDAVNVSWPSGRDFTATAPRSFSFWYKPISNGEGQYSRIISWSNDRLEIAGTNGTANSHRIAYFDGNWNETDITLTLGTWYHVTFTYDGTTARFYVGDELQDEHALAGRALSGTLRIGNRVQQLDEGINGRIDDVRIYDYALNQTQVTNLSSGSNNPDGDPTPTPTATPTRTPTPTVPVTASSTSSSSGTSSSSSVCSSQSPSSAPDLFQISTSLTSATLYFTPVNPATGYSVNYGTNSTANQYGASFDHANSSGSVSYTINDLAKGTRYYFRVQGKNNCAPGSWSQTLSQSTTGGFQLPSSTPRATPQGDIEVVSKKQTSQPKEEVKQEEKQAETNVNDGYDLTIQVVNNGKPVEGATVEVHSTPRRTTTDKDGYARFSNVEKGDHTVYLSYEDFQGEEKITLDGNEKEVDISFAVELKPKDTFLSPLAIGIIVLLGAAVLFLIFAVVRRKNKG